MGHRILIRQRLLSRDGQAFLRLVHGLTFLSDLWEVEEDDMDGVGVDSEVMHPFTFTVALSLQ